MVQIPFILPLRHALPTQPPQRQTGCTDSSVGHLPSRGRWCLHPCKIQNIQQLFKDEQLLESLCVTYILEPDVRPADVHMQMCATILDVDSMGEDIIAGLMIDKFTCDWLADLLAPWTRSPSGLVLYNLRVYVPDYKDLCLRVLQTKHDHESAGHPGFRKTLELVQREFYWPSLRNFVTEFCCTFEKCPATKHCNTDRMDCWNCCQFQIVHGNPSRPTLSSNFHPR